MYYMYVYVRGDVYVYVYVNVSTYNYVHMYYHAICGKIR
jgi:hypothetical protein